MLPLAFRISLPALNNNLVNLVKTTTLAFAIAVPEMLYVSSQIWSDELNVPVMMNVLLICYFVARGMPRLRHAPVGARDSRAGVRRMSPVDVVSPRPPCRARRSRRGERAGVRRNIHRIARCANPIVRAGVG